MNEESLKKKIDEERVRTFLSCYLDISNRLIRTEIALRRCIEDYGIHAQLISELPLSPNFNTNSKTEKRIVEVERLSNLLDELQSKKAQRLEQIIRSLKGLEPEVSETVMRRYIDGNSVQYIADSEGVSRMGVYKRLDKAIPVIARYIDENNIEINI